MKKPIVLLPKHLREMKQFGERLKLARLRRRLALTMVAERAAISKPTLVQIEKGNPAVSMGSYYSVMRVYGLESDFPNLANDDTLGRRIQDNSLPRKGLAPKRRSFDERGKDSLGIR